MLHKDNASESSALIIKAKKPLSVVLYDTASHYAPIAVQVGLGGVGLGAGFLYAGPATTCAKAASCGLWLSKRIGERAAIVVFFAGGFDYAGINAYFSSESVNNYFRFVAKQSSRSKKIGWGSAILVYTASQSVSSFLSSSTTNRNRWQIALTVAGAAPGNLYTAVCNAQFEIPMLTSYVIRHCRSIQQISDSCVTPSQEETLVRQQRAFYTEQRLGFLRSVNAHWSYIKSNPRERLITGTETPLSFLFSSPTADPREGFFRSTVNKAGQVVAVGMSSAISIPFIINNYGTIYNYVPSAAASGMITGYFSYSFLYSNFKLCMNFINGVILILDHLLTGRPIDSLAFQLHPYLTVGAVALILLTSALSYALMNVIYEMVFPEQGRVRDGFRYATDISMDFYHVAGLFHLYELLVSRLSQNSQDKFLLKVQAETDRFRQMTPEEYMTFVERNTDEENKLLGIQRFQRPAITINDSEKGSYQPTLFGAIKPSDSPEKINPAQIQPVNTGGRGSPVN